MTKRRGEGARKYCGNYKSFRKVAIVGHQIRGQLFNHILQYLLSQI